MKFGMICFAICVAACFAAPVAAEEATAPAIVELNVKPLRAAYGIGRNNSVEIKSAKEAAKYFDEKAVAEISKTVDFSKQTVLLFGWRGSGQDKLSYVVAESFPEQITFTLRPGRTRDLRQHARVFALRSNVKWSR